MESSSDNGLKFLRALALCTRAVLCSWAYFSTYIFLWNYCRSTLYDTDFYLQHAAKLIIIDTKEKGYFVKINWRKSVVLFRYPTFFFKCAPVILFLDQVRSVHSIL